MQKINIGTEINIQDLLTSRLLIQANSGGFNNALIRLNTLELIERKNGINKKYLTKYFVKSK